MDTQSYLLGVCFADPFAFAFAVVVVAAAAAAAASAIVVAGPKQSC